MTSTASVIRDARRLLGGDMESSARLCLADAIEAGNAGDFATARARALKSLAYSVGILSPVYRKHAAPVGSPIPCAPTRGWIDHTGARSFCSLGSACPTHGAAIEVAA